MGLGRVCFKTQNLNLYSSFFYRASAAARVVARAAGYLRRRRSGRQPLPGTAVHRHHLRRPSAAVGAQKREERASEGKR